MLHAVGILDDPHDCLHRDVEVVIDDDVIEYSRALHVFLCRLHLAYGDSEALPQLPVGFRPTLSQAFDQGVRRWRNDENAHRRRTRVHRPNLSCSLHLDIEHHVSATRQDTRHLALKRAVQFPRVLCPLQELTGLYPALKLRAGQEVIRLSFAFPWPRLARSRRHGISERVRPSLEQLARDGRLAAPGRGGEHHDPRCHSRLSSCSRNFSSSPFMAMTVCVMPESLAFDPIVFTSRSSSCPRNPSRFPTAPSAASASRHAARWVRNRTSSSVMSTRSAIKATSTASRCSSTGTPAASSATAVFNRASSAVSRSGARCSIVRAPVSSAPSRPPSSAARAAPSRPRMPSSSRTARSAIGSTSLHCAAAVPSCRGVSTSGCRATNARSTSPLSFRRFFSSFAAATSWRARARSSATAPSRCGAPIHRAATVTF